jgi:hypothetical protein
MNMRELWYMLSAFYLYPVPPIGGIRAEGSRNTSKAESPDRCAQPLPPEKISRRQKINNNLKNYL